MWTMVGSSMIRLEKFLDNLKPILKIDLISVESELSSKHKGKYLHFCFKCNSNAKLMTYDLLSFQQFDEVFTAFYDLLTCFTISNAICFTTVPSS